MTKPGRTAIAILVDRSRSARPIRNDLRTGLTDLLSEQRDRPGDVLAAVTSTGAIPALRPIAEVTAPAMRTRGASSLRDDLGELITGLGSTLSATPEDERPSRVLVLVVGAGTEGTAWSRDAIADLVVAQQRDYAWEFAFVGTADASETLGIRRSLTCTPSGIRAGLAAASGFLLRARDGQPWEPVDGYTDADREAAAVEAAPAAPNWWQRLLGRRPEMAA